MKDFWDASDESPSDKAILDGIVARATFGTSPCESPGCHDYGEGVGDHPAIFAFRITNKPDGATYENFCNDCENQEDDGPDCFMKRITFKGVLLCPCCTVAVVAGIRASEKKIDWIVRPLSDDTNAVLALTPKTCKIQSLLKLRDVPNVQRSAAAFFGEPIPDNGVEVGRAEITSVHAIEVTPELQEALERGDRAEVLRILTPIVAAQVAKSIATDMQLKIDKNRLHKHKRKPAITVDEVLDLEDTQVEGKTLQDLGLQIPKQHEDN